MSITYSFQILCDWGWNFMLPQLAKIKEQHCFFFHSKDCFDMGWVLYMQMLRWSRLQPHVIDGRTCLWKINGRWSRFDMVNLPKPNQTWCLWKQKGRRTWWVRRVPTASCSSGEVPAPWESQSREYRSEEPARAESDLFHHPHCVVYPRRSKELGEQGASVWILMQVQMYSDWGWPVNYIPYSKSSLRESNGCTSRATRGLNKHINIQVLKVTMTLTWSSVSIHCSPHYTLFCS